MLSHITDEKPITSRQCIRALEKIGYSKPQYIPMILETLKTADLSNHRESMRLLIEQDRDAAIKNLKSCR